MTAPALTYAERATNYARDVVAGRILAGNLVKKACQRHLDDIDRSVDPAYPYRFDHAATNRFCKFAELFRHVKGKWARRRIKLEDWQCFVFGSPFGWLRKADGKRRFSRIYIEVPRKNAKSTMAAIVGLYMFAADGESGAEVYSGAGSEKQALEVFGPARKMAIASPEFCEKYGVHVGAKNLSRPDGSKFEPIIGKPGDGASPSCPITDEYHEHKDSGQYDTMLTGTMSREQPISLVITTAGASTEGPCYAMHTEVAHTVAGTMENDDLFGVIYSLDEGDDWTTEDALRKANPNYGVSVLSERVQQQQRAAVNDPRKQASVKTKHFNIWVTAASPYLDGDKWKALGDPKLTDEIFAGDPAWLGMDLASVNDIASVARLFRRELDSKCAKCDGEGSIFVEDNRVECPRCNGSKIRPEPHYYVFVRNYLPESVAVDPAKVHYADWNDKGALSLTPGNITSYDDIEDDIKADSARFSIAALGFDLANATQLVQHCTAHGIPCVQVPQNVANLSEPLKELKALILSGRIHHDANPCTSWAIGNVTAKEDRNANVFPRKESEDKKIDPVVAILDALACALRTPIPPRSIYETRGPVVIR